MSDMDRRTFLAAAIGACACGACPLAAAAGEGAVPADPVEVGTLADYPRDSAYDAYAESHGFFLVRDGGRLYALGSACTHKKTLLKVKGDAFACPKHGARFSLDGIVRKPPAKKPLPRFAISADESGTITIDPSRTFDADEWDDRESYLPAG